MDRSRRSLVPWETPGPRPWELPWPDPWRGLWPLSLLERWEPGYPPLDLYEEGDDVVVEAELPGVDPDDVKVEVADHQLIIQGEVRRTREQREGGVYRQERRFGSFLRTVPLPDDVDVDRAQATFRAGVLQLRLPRKEGARRRQLPIRRET